MIWGRSAAVLVVYYLSKGNIPLSLSRSRSLSLSLSLSLSQMPNSEETVAVLMEQMDPDGSGTLDWEEFKILVKQVIGCLLQDVNGR